MSFDKYAEVINGEETPNYYEPEPRYLRCETITGEWWYKDMKTGHDLPRYATPIRGLEHDEDDFIYSASQKIITQIVKDQDEATYKAIERYCEENNIIPNIVSEDKLKLILQLGIQEYNKRQLKSKGE